MDEEHATSEEPKQCDAIVTPASPDATLGRPTDVLSPTLQLGLLHKDHSDDDSDEHVSEPAASLVPSSAFPETKFVLTRDELQVTNVTLPLSKLLEFLETSFKCRSCNSVEGKKFTQERYGIATSIYFECVNCGLATSCRADLTNELESKWASKPASKHFKDTKKDSVNAADFELNRKLYLATQQCGGGLTEAKVVAGVLGMHTNALKGRWSDISQVVGLQIIEVAKEWIDQNVLIEMELSPIDETTGRKKITACGDCRWDKRSSGRRYDSISGCSVLIGCRSQLVLNVAPMSNKCSKCSRKIPHDGDLCPMNVNCSSKAMEAIGSANIVEDLFLDYNAYIYEYVGDDDSSTKKVLRHSWEEEVIAGTLDEVPRYINGKKKPDNGVLPIEHPNIIWLADKGHRVRQFASKLFKLAGMKKADCEGTRLDAERMKRNLSYAIRCNCCCGNVEVLKKAVECVLEHHFNNHSLCSEDWCRVKNLEGDELEEAMLKYRSKETNGAFYLQVKALFEEFYALLHEMLHEWDTNIVEGLNKFFTKFLPKDRTYAMTIENKVRIYLAVAIDSVGYTETYKCIAEKTGLTYCEVQKELNLQLDQMKSYRRQYRKKDATKIRRMRHYYKKMADEKIKLADSNRKGKQYSSGMSGPFEEDGVGTQQAMAPTISNKRRKTNKEKEIMKCGHCGRMGHSRRTSFDCLQNPKRMAQDRAEEDTKQQAREKGTYIITILCDIELSM
jgi:hypothetical protein